MLILNLIQQVFGQDKDLIFPIYFVVFHFKFLHMISKLLFSEKIKAKKEQKKMSFIVLDDFFLFLNLVKN